MQSSTYANIKKKINVQALQKISSRQSALRMSNAVCIQNLMMKNSLFAPSKLEPIGLDNQLKVNNNLKLIRYKRQLQPHKNKVNSSIGKSMASLLNETNDFKQLRHKRNISAIWQTKKMNKQRQKKAQKIQPPTASFYLKKGQPPIFYELKMEIKKVQSIFKPLDKMLRSKYKKRNFLPLQISGQKQQTQKSLPNESIQVKQLTKSTQNNQKITQTQKKLITSQKFPASTSTKIQTQKQRFIKSTLVSYPSKNNNTNPSKNKQSIDLLTQLHHIKNILSQSVQQNEQNIQFVEPQTYIINNYQQNKQELNGKTANCISVCHFNSYIGILTPIFMKQPYKRVEIASITKIMTCFLVLNIVKFFKIDIYTQKVLVSQRASKMPGTSAGLSYSDILTVYQLLHALMLPSGNDAAVALAQWGGKTIRKYFTMAQRYQISKTVDTKSMNFITDYTIQKKSYQKLFIYHMNKTANALKLRNTKFVNPHGLMNEKAYSTSIDVALLTCIAMKNQLFAEIVRKKYFECKLFNRTYSQYLSRSWKNTNKLLNYQGFKGVKTGVTPSAGPCLSSMFSINQKQSIVIVVLKTRSMDMRFKQSFDLLKQTINKLGLGSFESLINKINEDDQSTAISLQNQKGQQANLVQDQIEVSDRQPQEDDQFQL